MAMLDYLPEISSPDSSSATNREETETKGKEEENCSPLSDITGILSDEGELVVVR